MQSVVVVCYHVVFDWCGVWIVVILLYYIGESDDTASFSVGIR